MGWKIPAFVADKTLRNSRHLATTALANSESILMARGLVDGTKIVQKFGAASAVGLSLVPISSTQTYKTPQIAEALEIVSDSTDDNGTTSPLGSGALIVRVYGIADWAVGEVTEDVTLDGTAAVALSTSFLRVYRMKVLASGTYASDAGPSHSSTITLRGVGAGASWISIVPTGGFGAGQTECAVYSVPAGKQAYVRHAEIYVESNKTANVLLFVRENADNGFPHSAMQAKIVLRNLAGTAHVGPKSPYGPFAGPCDLGWMGMANAQTANIEIDFEIIVIDE